MKDIKALIIGAIVLIALSSAAIGLVSLVNTQNPSFIGSDTTQFRSLNRSLNKVSDGISTSTNEINSTLNAEMTEGSFGFIDSLVKSVTTSLKTVGRSMKFLTIFFGNIGSYIPGIPSWVGGLITSTIIIIIGLALWKAIFKVS